MKYKKPALFGITCLLSAVIGIGGSFVGGLISWRNSWVGFLVGGAAGLALAVWIASRAGFIKSDSFLFTLAGGLVGLEGGLAAMFLARPRHQQVLFAISIVAVGLGAVIGNVVKERGRTPQHGLSLD